MQRKQWKIHANNMHLFECAQRMYDARTYWCGAFIRLAISRINIKKKNTSRNAYTYGSREKIKSFQILEEELMTEGKIEHRVVVRTLWIYLNIFVCNIYVCVCMYRVGSDPQSFYPSGINGNSGWLPYVSKKTKSVGARHKLLMIVNFFLKHISLINNNFYYQDIIFYPWITENFIIITIYKIIINYYYYQLSGYFFLWWQAKNGGFMLT